MAVRAGYQQTEVGVIPEDWQIYTLGEIGAFKNGINKGSDAFGQGTPFVNLMDIFGVNSLSSSENLGLITCNNIEKEVYNLKEGDVIFVRSSVKPSGVGLTAVVENDLANTVYSGFLIRYRDNGILDKKFKRYCFYEKRFRNSVINSSTVSANTNINQNSLKKLQIPLPPTLAEQEAIAAALSDADALIAALEGLIAKKRQVKQSVKEEIITSTKRLSGFSGDWAEKPIGEIAVVADFSANGSFADLRANVKYLSNPDYAILVRLTDFSKGWNDDYIYVPKYSYDFLKKSKLEAGDLVISNIGNAGTLFQVPNLGMPMTLGPNSLVIKTDGFPDTSKDFLFHLLSSTDGQNRIKKIIAQSAQPKFNKTDFRNMQIPFPKKEEQTAIAEILSDMDVEIDMLAAKLAKSRQVKVGIMQELLTGKVRLV